MSEDKKKFGLLKRWFGFGGKPEEMPAASPAKSPAKPPAAAKPKAQAPAKTAPTEKPTPPEKPAPAKQPATPKPAAGKPASKKPASKKSAASPAAEKSAPKKATKASAPAEATEGKATGAAAKRGAAPATAEKRKASKRAAHMQPDAPPPSPAPVGKPDAERPEDVSPPSRRTAEPPGPEDEAGPASPRPDRSESGKSSEKDKESGGSSAPPAGPGPAPEDEEEAGPTAPKPKQSAEAAPRPSDRPEEPRQDERPKKSWFTQLREGLSRSSNALSENIAAVLTKSQLDDEALDDLEDVLIRADLGVDMAARVRSAISKKRYDRGISAAAVRQVLSEEVAEVLEPVAKPFPEMPHKPYVWLVVGVNGTGKTTTIGKLAHRFAGQGRKVMLAAADTFRAAAIDQLKIWGDRVGVPVVAHNVGSDPAGVAYDGLERAREAGSDVLLIDTAGRLQNKADLMAELAKVIRVLRKLDESAPHGVLLVLDATTGQNALNQVELFQQVAGVTGLVVTKLDGTARGGILVAIAERFGLPVHAIGVGEGIEDLKSFDAEDFARAIAGIEEPNAAAA